MQIDGFTIVAQIVNFLILLVLLRRYLYRPVLQAMEEREQKIGRELEEARQKKVEADRREAEYQEKLRELEREKDQMLKEAKQKVDRQHEEMLEQARNEVEQVQEQWEEALETERNTFIQELEQETRDRLIGIIRSVLSDLSERSLESQVIENFMLKLRNMDKQKQKQLLNAVMDFGDPTIRSAFELSGEQQDRIKGLLRKMLASRVNCRFEVVPALGFGIEIRTGGWRIGWNLDSYLATLRNRMGKFFHEPQPGAPGLSEEQE